MYCSRYALLLGFLIFVCGCQKNTYIDPEDRYVHPSEQFSEFKVALSSAGTAFLEVNWNRVTNSHFKTITYSIFLDEKKIVEGITATKYTLVNLSPGKMYDVKVVASTADGERIEQNLEASTLVKTLPDEISVPYKPYQIYSFSRFSGTMSFARLSDGSHIGVSDLLLPYFFEATSKLVCYRLDPSGNLLWYRLIDGSGSNDLTLTILNDEKEVVISHQQEMTKLATSDGSSLLYQNFRFQNELDGITSVLYVSPTQMIVGSAYGHLRSINPKNFQVDWQRNNDDKVGEIRSINLDANRNILYIFHDRDQPLLDIEVHQCNPYGEFRKRIIFDKEVPGQTFTGVATKALLKDEDDNFYLLGNDGDRGFRCFKFDSEGNVLRKNLSPSGTKISKFSFTNHGDIIVIGNSSYWDAYPELSAFVFDKNLNVQSTFKLPDLPTQFVRGMTVNPDGSMNFFLEMETMIFLKTQANGKK